MRRLCLFLAGWLLVSGLVPQARAEVTLPCLFSDHMVLQRDRPVAVWGWAEAGEQVTVSLDGKEQTTTADADGRWRLTVGPLAAGGPHTMTVEGENKIVIEDLLVGEVWLCSGQSNMAMTVSRAADYETEQAAATHPKLRMLTVARQAAESPQEKCDGQWQVCSPETVGDFSATGYFFGRTLLEELDVPVGLVTSAWGGTAVEAWTSIEAQQSVPDLAPILEPWAEKIAGFDATAAKARYEKALAAWQEKARAARKAGKEPPRRPTAVSDPRLNQNRPANLFNGMIQPLIPYGFRGAIWYQGERNSHGEPAALYGTQLATLIGDWRARFGQGDFPFYFVQLPNYMAPTEQASEHSGWVMVREGMLKTLAVENTGMAITIDVGEARDIHPKNKQAVGYRLALWPLANIYGCELVCSGPIIKSSRRQGTAIRVEFDHVGEGLRMTDGAAVRGFAVAGADRTFVHAEAQIDGASILVSTPDVKQPVAVRYAWRNNPDVNLVNSADLPASPFRTDDWVEPIGGR